MPDAASAPAPHNTAAAVGVDLGLVIGHKLLGLHTVAHLALQIQPFGILCVHGFGQTADTYCARPPWLHTSPYRHCASGYLAYRHRPGKSTPNAGADMEQLAFQLEWIMRNAASTRENNMAASSAHSTSAGQDDKFVAPMRDTRSSARTSVLQAPGHRLQ